MGGLGRRQRRPGGLIAGREWPSLLFLAGQAVSMLGDGLAALAIPLLVLDLTRNPLVSALSAASVTVGYLLAGLPAGVLVDRLDPWRVLIAMDAARMVLFAGLLRGDPRPVFLAAGAIVVVTAAGGWAAGLRSAARSAARQTPRPSRTD